MTTPEEIITGYAATRRVFLGTKADERIREIDSQDSLAVINHSPDGFNWGYGGSGPAQLALAILLECTTHETAVMLYQDYKFEVIARLDGGEDFQIPKRDVLEWLDKKLGL